MKKILPILLFFVFSLQTAFAQDELPGGRVREKMIEYIQSKLGLSRAEAEKFQPVYLNYLEELKRTNREYRDRGLEREQKLLDVRLRYRDQFKLIIGDKRSNEVFQHEKEFIKTVRKAINERRQKNVERRADKRKNTEMLLQN